MPKQSNSDKLTEMESLVLKAQSIVDTFAAEPKMAKHFQQCHGIAILSAVEAGFLVSGQAARGILMRHDKAKQKWSPPCVISMAGAGIGIAAGISRKHVIIFLTHANVVHTLSGDVQLRLGESFGFAVGDMGQEDDFYFHISNRGRGSTSGFANSQGLYFGISLEGSILTAKSRANKLYYGENVSPKKILFGEVNVPQDDIYLKALHNSLNVAKDTVTTSPENVAEMNYKDMIPSPFLHKPNVEKVSA